jgi:general stress protein YciG
MSDNTTTNNNNNYNNKNKKATKQQPQKRKKPIIKKNDKSGKNIVGLAGADKDTILRVARSGGLAPHLKRGLQAITDPEIMKKITTAGGNARAKDLESLSKAGKRGDDTVKAAYGVEYSAETGKRGGTATYERYTATFYGDLGHKAGAAKKAAAIKDKDKDKTHND